MNIDDAVEAGKEWQQLEDFESVNIDEMMLSDKTVELILEAVEILDNYER